MDNKQSAIIQECVCAVVHGPFFEDWEFATVFGLSRANIQEILIHWPRVNTKDESVRLAIHNSFNNLIGYPIDHPEKWSAYFSVTKEQLADLYKEWRDEVYGSV